MTTVTVHLYWSGFVAIVGGIGGLALIAWATDLFRRPSDLVEQLREAPAELVDVVPVDPASIDATRPEDIDVCRICHGEGAVVWQTDGEWDSEECYLCRGTGVLAGAA